MDRNEAKKRIEKLRRQIEGYDFEYYERNAPLIPDFEYDRLYSELKNLEKQFPEFSDPDSPTQRVSEAPSDVFEKVRHEPRMYSLDNAYSDEELVDFDRKLRERISKPFTYAVEPKIDGIAVSIIYRNGRLFKGITRGDGIIGDDVTDNVRTISSLPERLNEPFSGDLTVRGEAFFLKSRFREIADEYGFANARNAAAGTMKLLEPSEAAKRGLSIAIHTVTNDIKPTHSGMLDELKRLGIPVVSHRNTAVSIDEVLELKEKYDKDRENFEYETDGLVVKLNELALRDEAGYTNKSPRWAFAFKFKPERAVTRIESVSFQVGRTGIVTPVANLSPVKLSGTVVRRATLHNFDEIARLGVHEEDYAEVEKSGEIIPKILRVFPEKREKKSIPVLPPENCPSCGSHLVKYENEVALRCINVNCPAQILGSIVHFASKQAMNIDGMGPSLTERLLEAGLVKSISDIYRLKKDELLSLERFKEKSAENLLRSVEASKSSGLSKLIFALGIRNIGEVAARALAAKFQSLDSLSRAGTDELTSVEGIGEESAEALRLFFENPSNISEMKVLSEYGVATVEKKKSDTLSGKTFVVTGTLKRFKRDEIKEAIASNGGFVSESVSEKTDFLIAGDSAGSKLSKAQALSVKIISEDDFLKMIGG